MIPILIGRIQTRLFASFTVGLIWTILITPFLFLSTPDGYKVALSIDGGLDDTYKLTLASLAITAVVGAFVWEPIYHFLMQFRWEKDWPAFFQLLEVVPEGLSTFLLLHVAVLNPFGDIGPDKQQYVPVLAYIFLFFTTWIIVWLFVNGPMKIFFVRWRFRGGRLI
ncbi:MAG TPA: hypothetical protein VF228_14570 [Iamia sp.]